MDSNSGAICVIALYNPHMPESLDAKDAQSKNGFADWSHRRR